MYEKYETLRSRNGIETHESKSLIEILRKDELVSSLEVFTGKNAIFLWNASFSPEKILSKGEFYSGTIKGLEFKEGRFSSSSDIRIWLGPGEKKGICNLYDVVLAETIEQQEDISADLNAYYFVSGNHIEEISKIVIHSNPFLAYKSIMEQKGEKLANQFLMHVEPIYPGKTIFTKSIQNI